MKATLYCDESGTTGNDWNNVQQPYLIYGGWLVPNENKKILKEKINKFLSSNLIYKDAKELKAIRFFKNGKNHANFNKIFNYFISEKSLPIFVILEKNFMISLKMIETFFDPAYSSLLKREFSCDIELKRSLANITSSKREMINKFSDLIHLGNLSDIDLRNLCNELAELFSTLSVDNISTYLHNLSDQALNEMLDEFQVANCERSLTIPALFHVLQLTENFCNEHNIYAQFIHDKITGYDNLIDIIKNNFISTNVPETIKIGNNRFYSNLPHILNIDFCDSKNEDFIQFADLLIGFILHTLKLIQNSQTLSKEQESFIETLIVLYDSLKTWDYNMSDEFIKKIFLSINPYYTDNRELFDYKLLNKKFGTYLR